MKAAAARAYPCEGDCGTAVDAELGYCDECALKGNGIDPPKTRVDFSEAPNERQNHPLHPLQPCSSTTDVSTLSLKAGSSPGPGPRSGPGTSEAKDMPQMRELLALQKANKVEPEFVDLGPMPPHATDPMHAIAEDIQNRLGLMLADGTRQPLMYAASEAVKAGHVHTKGGASWALKMLVKSEVILPAGAMPPLGKGNGTKLYVPPGWADLIERKPLRGIDGGAG